MRTGPKAAVDASPPPFLSSVSGSARFADFCRQFPVTYNPLLAGFGTVVHHVDPALYEQLRPGYLTDARLTHHHTWH